MTSTDREILISINDRVSRLEGDMTELKAEVRVVQDNQVALARRIDRLDDKFDMMQTSVYWIFAAIGIFLAAATFLPSALSSRNKETPAPAPATAEKGLSVSDVLNLIELSARKEKAS